MVSPPVWPSQGGFPYTAPWYASWLRPSTRARAPGKWSATCNILRFVNIYFIMCGHTPLLCVTNPRGYTRAGRGGAGRGGGWLVTHKRGDINPPSPPRA
eukprot:1176951-Prorocentrum_minimum.AAC.2